MKTLKRILCLFLCAAALTALFAWTHDGLSDETTILTMNAQNMENALTPRRQGLAVMAALEAKGDQAGLEKAAAEALDNGLTVSEAKEALSQLYAYTGFPRSLNALGTLQKVLAARQTAGCST